MPRQRLRLRYQKDEVLQYIGHRDLLRFTLKMLRLGGIPWLLKGKFSPRPQVTFAPPCPLGVLADNELVDVELAEGISWEQADCDAALTSVKEASSPREFARELTLLPVETPAISKLVRAAHYQLGLPGQAEAALKLLAADSLPHTTRQGKEKDLRPPLLSCAALDADTLEVSGSMADGLNLNVVELAVYLERQGIESTMLRRVDLLDEAGDPL